MMRSRLGTLGLVALLGLAACSDGDDPTGMEGLSEAQAQALAAAIFMQAYTLSATIPTGFSSVATMDDGPQAVPINQSAQGTLGCELGGSVSYTASIVGTVDDVTDAVDVTVTTQQDYDACRVSGGQETFTLDGTPGLTHTADITSDTSGNVYVSGMLRTGATPVSWSSSGMSGTCAVVLDYTGSSTVTGSGSFSVSGTVCGVLFGQDINVSAG
jgi:hypothetical protein